jgi:hypothetical protein
MPLRDRILLIKTPPLLATADESAVPTLPAAYSVAFIPHAARKETLHSVTWTIMSEKTNQFFSTSISSLHPLHTCSRNSQTLFTTYTRCLQVTSHCASAHLSPFVSKSFLVLQQSLRQGGAPALTVSTSGPPLLLYLPYPISMGFSHHMLIRTVRCCLESSTNGAPQKRSLSAPPPASSVNRLSSSEEARFVSRSPHPCHTSRCPLRVGPRTGLTSTNQSRWKCHSTAA